jgi:hypothetical protein
LYKTIFKGGYIKKYYTNTSTLVPLLNCALHVWDMYSRRMLKKNTKKIYQANLHQKRPNGRPKARWKCNVENGIRETEIVKLLQLAQDRDGWR